MIAGCEEPIVPEFQSLLESVIALGARQVEVEYDEGAYWVTVIEGHTGLGVARYESTQEQDHVYDTIQQLRKAKRIEVSGKNYFLKISTREDFGETTWIILVSEKKTNR